MNVLLLASEAAEAGGHADQAFPLLPAITLLPLFGAVAIALLPKRRPELAKLGAVLTSLGVLALTLYMLFQFDAEDPGFQFVSATTWIQALDIKFALGVDGISLFLVVLTAVLFPLALFAAKPDHDEKAYYGGIL